MFGTIDSTSGVLINLSFAHRGIIEVMAATRSGSLRYPGAPAVACAFDPVQVRYVYVCVYVCMYVMYVCMYVGR